MTLGKFYPYCVRADTPIAVDIKRTVERCVGAASSLTYEQLIARMQLNGAPPYVYPALEQAKAIYDIPAAPQMTKGQKEWAVLRCLSMFGNPPPDFADEEIPNFVMDGYRYYVRRVYLRGNAPLSARDVEYHIQASNLDFTKTKKEYHGWSCFVYINVPGYLCNGEYPSMPNTMFGVQWGKTFNG
jgi:hypothetical protein